MALIDAVFRRTGGDQGGRTMSFQTISEETRLPYEEVEHLMMKAMSYVTIHVIYLPFTHYFAV